MQVLLSPLRCRRRRFSPLSLRLPPSPHPARTRAHVRACRQVGAHIHEAGHSRSLCMCTPWTAWRTWYALFFDEALVHPEGAPTPSLLPSAYHRFSSHALRGLDRALFGCFSFSLTSSSVEVVDHRTRCGVRACARVHGRSRVCVCVRSAALYFYLFIRVRLPSTQTPTAGRSNSDNNRKIHAREGK